MSDIPTNKSLFLPPKHFFSGPGSQRFSHNTYCTKKPLIPKPQTTLLPPQKSINCQTTNSHNTVILLSISLSVCGLITQASAV